MMQKMMKKLGLLLVLGLGTGMLLSMAAPALAGTLPTGIVFGMVGGESVRWKLDDKGGLMIMGESIFDDEEQKIAEITLLVASDPDPYLEYVLGVKNNTGGTLSYSFLFLSPYVDGPYNLLQSSHSSSVTDGSPTNNSVTVAPFAVIDPLFIHVPQIDGGAVAAARIGDGCAVTPGAGGSDTCDGFSNLLVAVATAGSGTFGVTVSFDLSPGDIYSGNGRVELLVPEPTTMLLLGGGILGMFVVGRRKN